MKLDVRGEICPYPMMEAVKAMKKLKGDEALEVLTDHAPCLETIPPEAIKLGFDYEIIEA
ncbi:MAG: sulfurtransferase TusA family protein, partial [Chloroflexi bacterium]|nr:sulfurtransferase TusA family protein [Chloroflexota bacterium]